MSVHGNLIDGKWVGGEIRANINPSDTDDIVGEYALATPEDARDALTAAKAAQPKWANLPILARAQILQKASAEILARREDLATLLAREEGKTWREALAEVTRAGQIFNFFSGEVLRPHGDKFDSVRTGIEVETSREPVGVVALITPWNFPMAIPAWKVAPALAYGNAVILKPAELTPASTWALADILQRAGIPAGVFNLVMGRGSVLGDVLTGPGIDAVSFTGSVETGHHILQNAAKHHSRVQLEMGGKNPLVVLDDADLALAVRCALDGAFFSTGQRCTASSRLIVQHGIHDAFVSALADALGSQNVGHALSPETTIGPVVDERQLETDLRYIEIARDEGARLVTGGARLSRATNGFYLAPALFAETSPEMRINQEEVFGPVASVIGVRDYEQALQVANDVPFGLCAGICTNSLKHATHFRRNARVGMVMVNTPTAGVDFHAPFGGRKSSSYGAREQGAYAAEFYTVLKTSYINA